MVAEQKSALSAHQTVGGVSGASAHAPCAPSRSTLRLSGRLTAPPGSLETGNVLGPGLGVDGVGHRPQTGKGEGEKSPKGKKVSKWGITL